MIRRMIIGRKKDFRFIKNFGFFILERRQFKDNLIETDKGKTRGLRDCGVFMKYTNVMMKQLLQKLSFYTEETFLMRSEEHLGFLRSTSGEAVGDRSMCGVWLGGNWLYFSN